MGDLILELRHQVDKTPTYRSEKTSGILMMTPPIDEDYWLYRVKLYADQSIIGFPKFCTIGIGFAREEDWNTNLPYTQPANKICEHIWHNHKYEQITKADVIKAIEIIQAQASKDTTPSSRKSN